MNSDVVTLYFTYELYLKLNFDMYCFFFFFTEIFLNLSDCNWFSQEHAFTKSGKLQLYSIRLVCSRFWFYHLLMNFLFRIFIRDRLSNFSDFLVTCSRRRLFSLWNNCLHRHNTIIQCFREMRKRNVFRLVGGNFV